MHGSIYDMWKPLLGYKCGSTIAKIIWTIMQIYVLSKLNYIKIYMLFTLHASFTLNYLSTPWKWAFIRSNILCEISIKRLISHRILERKCTFSCFQQIILKQVVLRYWGTEERVCLLQVDIEDMAWGSCIQGVTLKVSSHKIGNLNS